MKNEGKKFEEDVKNSAINQNIWIIRLNDSSLSWQHEKTSRFTVENPADFLVYQKPNLLAVECKSTKYKSMSIQRSLEEDKSKMIKFHQINSLVNFSRTDGIYAGLLLNFRDEEIMANSITYWLPIEDFSNFLVEMDKGSINKLDCVQHGAIIVEQKLKRTRFAYNIQKLIDDIRQKKGG